MRSNIVIMIIMKLMIEIKLIILIKIIARIARNNYLEKK